MRKNFFQSHLDAVDRFYSGQLGDRCARYSMYSYNLKAMKMERKCEKAYL